MEEILKFLLIAGVIIIAIIKQVSKSKAEQADKKSHIPVPMPNPTDETGAPVPDQWGNVLTPKKTKKAKATPVQPATPPPAKKKTLPATTESEPTLAEDSEFAIHSAEEARRAIIWSEILNRKY